MNPPVLETAWLRLRGHRLDDFENCAALWADPLVTQHITGVPMTREESWSRLLRYAGHWSLLGFGYWVAEEKATGAFVGEVGFADYKRDIVPRMEGVPEAGWVIASAARGKGYATEAVTAVLAWGDANFTSPLTSCIIAPENAASIRVADKCGFQEIARTTYKGGPAVVLTRSRRL